MPFLELTLRCREAEQPRYETALEDVGAKYELRGRIAVITLDNPPVNGLGYDTRREFSEGVDRARSVVRRDDVVSLGPEPVPHRLVDQRLVLDDEDRRGGPG